MRISARLMLFVTLIGLSFCFLALATDTVFADTLPNPLIIRDDALGGDCTLVGSWDNSTKTCTFNTNTFSRLEIISDGITIDGAGFAILGSNFTSGIALMSNGNSSLTVRNLHILGFERGIFVGNGADIVLDGLKLEDSRWSALMLQSLDRVSVVDSTIAGQGDFTGIEITSSSNATMTDNIIEGQGKYGIYAAAIPGSSIEQNTICNGYEEGLHFDQLQNVKIKNNVIEFVANGAVFASYGAGLVIENNIVRNNASSAVMFKSTGLTYDTVFRSNTFADSPIGIDISFTTGTVANPPGLPRHIPTVFTRNTFHNLDAPVVVRDPMLFPNINLSAPLPDGGNYWEHYDETTEGCMDTNNDSFCDESLSFSSLDGRLVVVDDFPHVFSTPPSQTITEKAVEKAKAVIDGPYTFGAKGWDFKLKKYLAPAQIKDGSEYWNYSTSTSPIKGLDCSGLTLWSYDSTLNPTIFPINNNGTDDNIIKYQSADGQHTANTIPIPIGSEQSGDLMFFNWDGDYDDDGTENIDHVALYTGLFTHNGQNYDVVHASIPGPKGILAATTTHLKALPGFVGFGRVNDPRVELSATTHSPIDLIVTDPEGITITPTTTVVTNEEINREVPGELYYSVYDVEDDGTPKTEVYSPHLKQGNYLIKPIKRADAAPGSVYGLTVTTDFGVTVLAEDIPVEDIPEAGYGVRVTESGVETFVPDNTPPEAVISVDPTTKDLKVVGVDETSNTTVAKIASGAYVITDAASNTTKLLFQKNYSGKLLSYAKLIGVQYNNASITPVATSSMLYIWNPTTNPPTLLSQTLVVNNTFGIEAVFDRKKNQTTVLIKKKGIPMQSQKFTGLTIIKLTTDNGVVGYAL